MNILIQNPALWNMLFNNDNIPDVPAPAWLWGLVALVGAMVVAFLGYLIIEIVRMK